MFLETAGFCEKVTS